MLFFACILWKLEPMANLEAFSDTIFWKLCKWPPLARSSSQYFALFMGTMSTRRCGAPILERISCPFLNLP